MFLTTRGLVLREAKYKESDKILTILTAEEGKLTVKARGVARTRSKISAATQLYGYAEFTLFGNRGMWTVNEAESIEQFRPLREDIKRLALAGYICELLEAVSDEDCPEPEMLQLGLNCLYALSNKLATRDVVKAVFELRLMCIAMPFMSICYPMTVKFQAIGHPKAGGDGRRGAGAGARRALLRQLPPGRRAEARPLGALGDALYRQRRAEEDIRLRAGRRGGGTACLRLRGLRAP